MTSAAVPADSGIRPGMGILLATCISTLIVNANTSAVTILLPAIAEDVDASISTLQWAVTGYSLVGAAFIVTSGALGDVFGRRKIFIGGLLLFIASCILIALAGSGLGVILGRCIQGASGCTILASGLSLLTVASSGSERLRAVSLWGAASAVGAAAGPLIGGVLVDSVGWQGLFWLDAAIAALLIPVVLKSIEESRDPNRSTSIDWLGTVLVATILAPMILAMSKGGDWGWASVAVLGCLVVSVASVFAFIAVEKRSPAPLIDLQLMRNRVLIGSTIGILIGAGTINGLMFVVSLYFQDPSAFGMSPLEAGLATIPATIALVISAPFVPKWADKWGARRIIGLGFLFTAVGFAALAFVKDSWSYGLFVIPFVAAAIGMSMSNGPCSSASTSAVPTEQVGSASGISNMARYVGAAVWVALAAAVYDSTISSKLDDGAAAGEALASGLSRVSIVMAVSSALGIPLVMMGAIRKRVQSLKEERVTASAAHSHTIALVDTVPSQSS